LLEEKVSDLTVSFLIFKISLKIFFYVSFFYMEGFQEKFL